MEQRAAADLKQGRTSGDALQCARGGAASPQLSVSHHRGGGEGVGVTGARAVTRLGRGSGGLRGGGQTEWMNDEKLMKHSQGDKVSIFSRPSSSSRGTCG